MATVFYQIKGVTIDMTPVYAVKDTGEWRLVGRALKDALVQFEPYSGPCFDVVMMYIVNSKQLPSEADIESMLDGIISTHISNSDTRMHQEVEASNVPKCPTCGSTKLQKLGIGTRVIDGFFFGKMSPEARAQFWCRNCDYRF